jgi:hypothetical protein
MKEICERIFEIVQINVYNSPLYQVFVFSQQIFLKATQYLYFSTFPHILVTSLWKAMGLLERNYSS